MLKLGLGSCREPSAQFRDSRKDLQIDAATDRVCCSVQACTLSHSPGSVTEEPRSIKPSRTYFSTQPCARALEAEC